MVGRKEKRRQERKKDEGKKEWRKKSWGCGSDGRMLAALGIKASTQVYNYDTFGDVWCDVWGQWSSLMERQVLVMQNWGLLNPGNNE